MYIEDPQTGRRVEVTDEGLLNTKSVNLCFLGHQAQAHANAFILATPELSLTATGGRMLWFEHLRARSLFIVHKIRVSFNGGDTSHNRVCLVELYVDDGDPSANNTALPAANTTVGENSQTDISAQRWDGVSDGMTVVAGNRVGGLHVGQGLSELNSEGSLVLPVNHSMSINLNPEEAGKASVLLTGYFVDQ